VEKSDEMNKGYGDFKTLFIVFIVSISLFLVSLVITCISLCNRKALRYAIIARIIVWIITLPSMFICIASSSQLKNYFGNITSQQCSSDLSNAQFGRLKDEVSSDIHNKAVIGIVLNFGSIFLEAIQFTIQMIKVKNGGEYLE
jgi:phosphoglycerol transferase MdoB-like AlkP superfamily enzyme